MTLIPLPIASLLPAASLSDRCRHGPVDRLFILGDEGPSWQRRNGISFGLL